MGRLHPLHRCAAHADLECVVCLCWRVWLWLHISWMDLIVSVEQSQALIKSSSLPVSLFVCLHVPDSWSRPQTRPTCHRPGNFDRVNACVPGVYMCILNRHISVWSSPLAHKQMQMLLTGSEREENHYQFNERSHSASARWSETLNTILYYSICSTPTVGTENQPQPNTSSPYLDMHPQAPPTHLSRHTSTRTCACSAVVGIYSN